MNPKTWYVREGETNHIEIVGIRIGNNEAESLAFTDGGSNPAVYVLCIVDEAESDDPLLLKQFGYVDLLEAGWPTTDSLDPGTRIRVHRFEDGGFSVEIDPEEVSTADEAM